MDVEFGTAVIGNVIANYAGQDFQALAEGVAPPFTQSEQSGDVKLATDLITSSQVPIPNNVFGYGLEDLETYAVGTITLLSNSISFGDISMGNGFCYPGIP